MKTKYKEKLEKYVTKNRLSKLKHLRRKHELDVSSAKLKNRNTLLHIACERGYSQVARYLQKHGCCVLTQNIDGDTPLHKACHYFMMHSTKSVYESLVAPLSAACPEAFHVRNKVGMTPEDLLQKEWTDCEQSPISVSSGSDSDSDRHQSSNRDLAVSLQHCIEIGDLSSVKRVVGDQGVTVQMVVFSDGNTPLHTAAEWGQVTILSYLLSCGCDPLLVNSEGDLPLHNACRFARETNTPYVYEDLVVPLVTAAPDSVNVTNNRGVTCADTVTYLRARAKEGASKESPSRVSEDEDDSRFCRKLFEEMMWEYGEMWGDYEQDFAGGEYGCEETGDWMDRMAEERNKRHRSQTHSSRLKGSKKAKMNGQRSEEDSGRTSTSQGRISEEEKAKFNRKLKAQYAQEQEMLLKKNVLEKRLKYELKCENVFKKTSVLELGYKDIPWPHDKDKGLDNVIDFLFGHMDRQSEEYKKYVKVQQVRWHPDRFLQKCGDRLKKGEQEMIMTRVNEISQLLNAVNK